MKRHLLIICNEFGILSTGGIGSFYHSLTRCMVRKDWDVTVVGIYAGVTQEEREDDAGVTVFRLPKRSSGRGRYRLNMFLERLDLANWIRKYHRRKRIDLIEAPDYQGWLWAVPAVCPRIVRLHGPDFVFLPAYGRSPDTLKVYFEKASLRKAERVVAVSKHIAAQVSRKTGRLRSTTEVIPNMVNTDDFSGANAGGSSSQRVINVGTVSTRKGVFQLLRAWKRVHEQVPAAKLIFYGNDALYDQAGGSTISHMREEAQEAGIGGSVEFAGPISRSRMPEVYREAEIAVFPSFVESFGIALLEAMASGLPVIASMREPFTEIVNDQRNGLLVDPDDEGQIAEKILVLLKDSELRKKISASARAKVLERFSHHVVCERNLQFFEGCLKAA